MRHRREIDRRGAATSGRDRRDGRLELRFICSPSQEVTSWVTSWRDQVEVVAPDTLRAELATLGQWMQQTYGERVPR